MLLVLLKILIWIAFCVAWPAGIIAVGIRNGARFGDDEFNKRFRWVVPAFCFFAIPYVVICTLNWPDNKWLLVALGVLALVISLVISGLGQFGSTRALTPVGREADAPPPPTPPEAPTPSTATNFHEFTRKTLVPALCVVPLLCVIWFSTKPKPHLHTWFGFFTVVVAAALLVRVWKQWRMISNRSASHDPPPTRDT